MLVELSALIFESYQITVAVIWIIDDQYSTVVIGFTCLGKVHAITAILAVTRPLEAQRSQLASTSQAAARAPLSSMEVEGSLLSRWTCGLAQTGQDVQASVEAARDAGRIVSLSGALGGSANKGVSHQLVCSAVSKLMARLAVSHLAIEQARQAKTTPSLAHHPPLTISTSSFHP